MPKLSDDTRFTISAAIMIALLLLGVLGLIKIIYDQRPNAQQCTSEVKP